MNIATFWASPLSAVPSRHHILPLPLDRRLPTVEPSPSPPTEDFRAEDGADAFREVLQYVEDDWLYEDVARSLYC
jgi:hypothetical protein